MQFKDADHVIILSDRKINKEDADIDTILPLLKMKDIKEEKPSLSTLLPN